MLDDCGIVLLGFGCTEIDMLHVAFCLQSLLSEIMQRSVLGQLLPEAMVNYLENHGAEKFAQIFLGEFDTPEAIWNAEMRQVHCRIKSVCITDIRYSFLLWVMQNLYIY